MTNDEMIREITEVKQRSLSNTHRIDRLEEDNKAIHELAASVRVLATKQETTNEKIDGLSEEVSKIKSIPAERWRAVIGYILAALCSAGVGAIITYLFK